MAALRRWLHRALLEHRPGSVTGLADEIVLPEAQVRALVQSVPEVLLRKDPDEGQPTTPSSICTCG